jgi:hypothetical protein
MPSAASILASTLLQPCIFLRCISYFRYTLLLKGKEVPVHTMEAQGERRYSSYSFMTSALDGVNGQHHAPAALFPPGKGPALPI